MALEFYVEQADRSPQSGVVDEEVQPGELISDTGSGVTRLEYADSGEGGGLARYDATAFAREYDDDVRTPKYVPNDAQRERAQYQPIEDSAIVKIRTPEDNGTDPAPAVGHKTTVGIIDADGGTVASADEYKGRVVEEGYTDNAGTPTTYNRGNNNFKAVGVAYRPAKRANDDVTDYDAPVRVVLFSELKE